jgi:hypothetical protein
VLYVLRYDQDGAWLATEEVTDPAFGGAGESAPCPARSAAAGPSVPPQPPSGNQFAALIGWQQSRVSKLETGKQLPTEADIRAWVAATRSSESVESHATVEFLHA